MKPIRVFEVLARRRFLLAAIVFVLVLGAGIGLGGSILHTTKKAQALSYNADSLILGSNDVMYIGAGGYVSQKFYYDQGMPTDSAKQLPAAANPPADGVYTASNISLLSSGSCPGKHHGDSGGAYQNCAYITGNGSGMIIKFNKSIQIDGTIYIGDRVVLEAPTITINSTARIYADGQAGHLAFGDGCGVGGIGGISGGNGGSNTEGNAAEHDAINCPDDQNGQPGAQNLAALNSSAANYFNVNSQPIVGGSSGASSNPIDGVRSGIAGAAGGLGIGAGGPSGAIGASGSKDKASSGGGGGGFGLVVHATTNLNIQTGALITAAGGNSLLNSSDTTNGSDATPQETGHGYIASGGFGAPGGGGVIIIDTPNISFSNSAGSAVAPDYSSNVFSVKAGEFDYSVNLSLPLTPGKAADGKLILNIGNGTVSVKKTVTNVTAGTDRPNYVFRSGDSVKITLEVSNLMIGQPVTIKDEVFSDGKNFPLVDSGSISDKPYGQLSGGQIVWIFAADKINATSKILTYTMTVK